MNRKLMLLALGAVSAMMLAAPAMASAIIPLHLNGSPFAPSTIHGGASELRTTSGTFVKCSTVEGTANWTSSTGGTMHLSFKGNCLAQDIFPCAEPITAGPLPFHLVTVTAFSPGILITPPAGKHFATFNCSGITSTIEGNGIIGTIAAPACGASATFVTVRFYQQLLEPGEQVHKTVDNTFTQYNLKRNGVEAAMTAHVSVNLGVSRSIVCT